MLNTMKQEIKIVCYKLPTYILRLMMTTSLLRQRPSTYGITAIQSDLSPTNGCPC